MNRRKFLKAGALTAPFLTAKNALASTFDAGTKPIVVSTWNSGKAVNAEAWKVLSVKGRALDAIEAGARQIEDELNCCVGLGGYPDRDGIVTLDSCIMDEHSNCGAVAGIERIKHPVSVARMVMEKTPHVILVGAGAQQFALENGFPLESGELSESAKKAYEDWLKKSEYKPVINIENKPAVKKQNGPFAPNFFEDGTANHDTMGLVAMDALGNLSGAVTTSGMAFKVHGRVGDSPIIGAGLFVDNEVGAATSSGVGEEVIRICGTHLVVEFMRQGYSPEMACKKAVERIVNRDPKKAKTLQVGFLALNKKGQHGAYAIQKGFEYCVKSNDEEKLYQSKFIL
ncbi:MAG: N(4)-(beta-N-acetylglucosaminyl)-L-asparaginase [Chitinophagaceae bacterium]|nr:N(4)-(beta-N-acetylglucosaminyl)-L-asparaginase [Chitinophagaceae bacterium]MBL0057040.1 N(4)-(beta-N-acetylglucosaminyl)-L-asparaginase [Chitinophagaceae bacterium]